MACSTAEIRNSGRIMVVKGGDGQARWRRHLELTHQGRATPNGAKPPLGLGTHVYGTGKPTSTQQPLVAATQQHPPNSPFLETHDPWKTANAIAVQNALVHCLPATPST